MVGSSKEESTYYEYIYTAVHGPDFWAYIHLDFAFGIRWAGHRAHIFPQGKGSFWIALVHGKASSQLPFVHTAGHL